MRQRNAAIFLLLLFVVAIIVFTGLIKGGYFEHDISDYIETQKENDNRGSIENTRHAIFILIDSKKGVSNSTINRIYGKEFNGKFSDRRMRADVDVTYNAVVALDYVELMPKFSTETVKWLKSCQNDDGGFGRDAGLESNMMSTYHAIKSLYMPGSKPEDIRGAIKWIQDRQNSNGGFGFSNDDKDSLMMNTYYAASSLDLMNEKPKNTTAGKQYIVF
ncbi:MAG: hypothetical protein CVT90_02125 [Candidatus Altiarchaeales archaeon HGW-Altiarchaeales-3]|nr:MAG: hypothetical protein CVT90_02125 [Candidatus Altiarchaeales archaeon HGW-Altiarchaeales-3]